MHPALSVVIPAHNEAGYIERCLVSIARSARYAAVEAEVVVVLNRCTDHTQAIAEAHGARCVTCDRRCIAAIRNAGVRATSTNRILTIDADSWMGDATILDALEHFDDPRWVGGGTVTLPERWSLGIVCTLLVIAPYVAGRGISGGMFWFTRDRFEAIGGFDEAMISAEDFDFALRLKVYGTTRRERFGTLRRGRIRTSCRKFDTFGDWYLVKNPGLVKQIFAGNDRRAADGFYYEVNR